MSIKNVVATAAGLLLASSLLVGCGEKESEVEGSAKQEQSGKAGEGTGTAKLATSATVGKTPYVVSFSNPGQAERNVYDELADPEALELYYHAHKTWDESLYFYGFNNAQSEKLREVSSLIGDYASTQDAFEKREIAQKVEALINPVIEEKSKNRLVKVTLNHNEWGTSPVQSYNFETKAFTVQTPVISEGEKARGATSFIDSRYKAAVVNAGPLLQIAVEDEQMARKIEAARVNSKGIDVIAYGFISEVSAKERDGNPADGYVLVTPHFIDLVDSKSGELLVSTQ